MQEDESITPSKTLDERKGDDAAAYRAFASADLSSVRPVYLERTGIAAEPRTEPLQTPRSVV